MKSIQQIITQLQESPQILAELMSEIPPSLWKHRGEYPWSITEHCNHICRGDSMVYIPRIKQIILESQPVIKPIDGESFGEHFYRDLNIPEELELFRTSRAQTIGLVRDLSDIVMDKEVKHPEYYVYNLKIMLRHLLMHDFAHMYKVEHQWLSIK